MIKLIVADDHSVVRAGLREIFARTTDIRVVAEAGNALQLLDALAQVECDIVLQDMSMPGLSGAQLVRRVREQHSGVPVLVLSMHTQGQVAASAIRAGAHGYVAKDSDPEIMVAAVRQVARGGRYVDPSLLESMVFAAGQEPAQPIHELLSQRELQVFRLMLAGQGMGEMADALGVSTKTVSTYKARVFEKLQVCNLVELVRYAVDRGLIE